MGFLDDIREHYGTQKPAPVLGTGAPVLASLDGATAYALAALNRECTAMACTLEGGRNDQLNISAYNLGQLAGGGQLPENDTQLELVRAARAAGLTDSEIMPTLKSGWEDGMKQPRYPSEAKEESWLSSLPQAPTTSTHNGPPPARPGTVPETMDNAQLPWNRASAAAPQTDAGKPTTTSTTPWETPSPPASGNSPTPTTNGSATTGGSETAQAKGLPPLPPERLYFETGMEYLRLKAREQAQRILKAEKTAATAPDRVNLTEFLKIPDEDVRYRIHGLLPAGGRVILAAQYKAGKSSMVGNLVKSLADGTAFLDKYASEQVRKISVIDNELDPRTLRRWLRDQQIDNTDSVDILALRGAVSTFDILDPETRAQWAEKLQGSDVVILDCLRPVLDALGLAEDKDAGKFLVAFDALLAEAGAEEAVIVHHMGHAGNRSRGDSRILDWPDATWTLKREDPEDPNSTRFFEALGRDVKVNESQLGWDEETRHLSIVGGNRHEAKAADLIPKILETVGMTPHISRNGIQLVVGGNSTDVRIAIKAAVEEGLIVEMDRGKIPGLKGGGYAYVLGMPLRPPETPDLDQPQPFLD